jgi:Rrf2 family iron-sulfur cluster assembly transcriptional regulator
MIFSNPIQYAIRAVTYLGGQDPEKLCSIYEIAREMEIPRPFLAKIVNRLSRRGLVKAKRGPSGGVRLARKPFQITVYEIVDVMGAGTDSEECILGLSACSDLAPCPLHDNWKSVKPVLLQSLHGQTVADLVAAYNAKQRLAGSA